MKWLAERIKAHGFKPGIWIAPYVVSEQTTCFGSIPMARAPPRRLAAARRQLGEREIARGARRSRQALLPRHHASGGRAVAARSFRDDRAPLGLRDDQARLRGMVDARGGALPRSSALVAEVYRRGLEIMRAGAGETATSSTAGPATRRSGSSTACASRPTSTTATRRRHGGSISRIPRAARPPRRSATTFTGARGSTTSTTSASTCSRVEQAEAAATLVALSGGNMISGDRLDRPRSDQARDPEENHSVVRRSGRSRRPFRYRLPTTFVLRIERPFARMVGCRAFQPGSRQRDRATLHVRPAPARPGQDLSRVRLLAAAVRWRDRERARRARRARQRHAARAACRDRRAAASVDEQARHAGRSRDRGRAVECSGAPLERDLDGSRRQRARRFRLLAGRHPWTWRSPAPFPRSRGLQHEARRLERRAGARALRSTSRVAWRVDAADFPI